jgi:hypothetical protein
LPSSQKTANGPFLRHINPVHISTQSLRSPNFSIPSGFATKILYAFHIFPMRLTCPEYLIPLDFNSVITCCEVYKLRSSSLCISYFFKNVLSSHLHLGLSPSLFLSGVSKIRGQLLTILNKW